LIFPSTVAVVSLLFHYTAPPASFFSDKYNFLNTYFVKWSWAWTSLPLAVYICYTNLKVTQSFRALLVGMIRWMLATGYWYAMTQQFFGPSIFARIYHARGVCSIDSAAAYHECKAVNGKWESFDVSGHCFILIHASLFILEEIRVSALSLNMILKNGHAYRTARRDAFESVLLVGLIAMLIIWYLMLIMTCVYFHTWSEKAFGTFFGLLFWLGTYRYSYQRWFAMPPTVIGYR
jgi:hypothetical protein